MFEVFAEQYFPDSCVFRSMSETETWTRTQGTICTTPALYPPGAILELRCEVVLVKPERFSISGAAETSPNAAALRGEGVKPQPPTWAGHRLYELTLMFPEGVSADVSNI